MKTEDKVVKSKAELNEGMFCQPEIIYGQETVLENGFYVRKEIPKGAGTCKRFNVGTTTVTMRSCFVPFRFTTAVRCLLMKR